MTGSEAQSTKVSRSPETSESIERADLSDAGLSETAQLLRLVWPKSGHITGSYLSWLYRDNPLGSAESFNARIDGVLVAHYAAIPLQAQINGVVERGLLSLNTAIHPQHRGRGYFKKLAAATFQNAASNGARFVVGVSNAKSTLLFLRTLRFQLVSPLLAKLGVGPVPAACRTDLNPSYQRLWDDDTVAWRLAQPSLGYRAVRQRESAAVYAPTGRWGIYAQLGRFTTLPAAVSLKSLCRWNPITLWIGLDSRVDWRRSLFMDIPEKFKPSPLNLIFKDLSDQKRVLSSDRIIFSLLDFDAY